MLLWIRSDLVICEHTSALYHLFIHDTIKFILSSTNTNKMFSMRVTIKVNDYSHGKTRIASIHRERS